MGNQFTPAGAVQYFARDTAPEGWLVADGRDVSRDQYPDLFAAIKVKFGMGDGVDTFGLPDLRGEFIRGLDSGRGVDAGRKFGSSQKGSINVYDPSLTSVGVASILNLDDNTALMNQRAGYDNPTSIAEYNGLYHAYIGGAAAVLGSDGYGFGVSRPRNIALLACIKY